MTKEGVAAIRRRELVLLLIGCGPSSGTGDGVGGITRLQKLLFLLEKEGRIEPSGEGFTFEPYAAGPYSSKLYDDLEFLENLGLLISEVTAETTEEEESEVERINQDIDLPAFEDLIGDGSPAATDAYEEKRFTLSTKGKARIEALLQGGEYQPVVDGIRKVKKRYGELSLSDLLYHVYTTYPEMTTESVIKEKVLRRRR